jgi:putative membrane protein
MSSVTTAGEAPLGDEHVDSVPPDATRLAVDRTRLAFERTMMAWVRTATSLITFGFTVYKFFQLEEGAGEIPRHLIGAREFALMMISIGIFSLLLATLQHRQNMQILRVHYRGMHIPRSLAALVGAFIALLGLAALIAVILRR